VAVSVAVSISGGSYALWTDSRTANLGTIAAGNATLTIAQSIDSGLWSNLLPGESVRQSFTVTNTGSVPMTIEGSASAATSSIEIRLAAGTCPGTALTSPLATVSATALGSLAAGATTTVCLETRLAAAATPGASSAFTVTVSGNQV
jgi:predicted ribosomally synthesized peptide with SipW-like signal peptide